MEEQQSDNGVVEIRLDDDRCANCGTTEFLAHRMVVPEAVGGKDVPTNYVLLCRACEFAASLGSQNDPCRAVNVYLSRTLYDRVRNTIAVKNGHASLSSLARFLVASYIQNPERYEDISNYQDDGTDVRANMWLDGTVYDEFKRVVFAQGLTVTDVLKGMLQMYAASADQKKECTE